MTNLLIETAALQEKYIVANLMQLYSHDLSDYQDAKVDDRGLFGLGAYFDVYWTEVGRHPFLIWVDGKLAGFAFIRQLDDATFSIAEFFITRSFRRSGVGARAATELFDRFPGRWQVAEIEKNHSAQEFWRRVISDYTKGEFSEAWSEGDPTGPMQIFNNLIED